MSKTIFRITLKDLAYYLMNNEKIPFNQMYQPSNCSMFRILKTMVDKDLKLYIALVNPIQNMTGQFMALIIFYNIDKGDNTDLSIMGNYDGINVDIYKTHSDGSVINKSSSDHILEDIDNPLIGTCDTCLTNLDMEISLFLVHIVESWKNDASKRLPGMNMVHPSKHQQYMEAIWEIEAYKPVMFIIDKYCFIISKYSEGYQLRVGVEKSDEFSTHKFADLDMVFSYILCSIPNSMFYIKDKENEGDN